MPRDASLPIVRFRPRFLGPTLRLAVMTALAVEVGIRLEGNRIALDEWAVIQTGTFICSAVGMGLFALVYRLRLSPTGIRSPDWPLVREFAWDRIDVVRRVNLLGFRFLALYEAGNDFGVWIPLFLKGEDDFWRVVRACVGPDHPMRGVEKE